MKSKITLALAFFIASATSAFAQMQRMSTEERVKNVMEKLAPLNLTQDQQDKTKTVFTDFYNNQMKMMQEARESGQMPDRSAFEKLTASRDKELQTIMGKDLFKKFKDDIEPSMRPQRRNN
ncbi:MAG TPA: hypothetical protein PLM81_00045 [Ginsengibacter sp.]|nr:hypothetical protein [Chitinophagaceae bacterium]MCZ2396234.1 hypothetical protein [Chitinophagales bacterium]HRN71482.1 hypothetical protein [Ginsengibacter sp.]MCO5287120.1 hypothetical protein [Chitinophagaceae bacterium]MCW5914892.1 hypothetical protein [Chitinophagaceae bacterium]